MAAPDETLTRAPGLYAIGFTLTQGVTLEIGALGNWSLPSGSYIYVGSAWGSGGLRARVGRHLRGSTTRHWHIDYLRTVATPAVLWIAPQQRDECSWATWLLDQPETALIVPRFGASDCTCAAHLAYVSHLSPTLTFPHAQRLLL